MRPEIPRVMVPKVRLRAVDVMKIRMIGMIMRRVTRIERRSDFKIMSKWQHLMIVAEATDNSPQELQP